MCSPDYVLQASALGRSKHKSDHHVKMTDETQKKSAFITWMGNNPMLFEFIYMPFGLVSAPATFQRCMNNALHRLDQSKVFCYLDDILIVTKTVEDHLSTLGSVPE